VAFATFRCHFCHQSNFSDHRAYLGAQFVEVFTDLTVEIDVLKLVFQLPEEFFVRGFGIPIAGGVDDFLLVLRGALAIEPAPLAEARASSQTCFSSGSILSLLFRVE
jgi:hypothetical protein